MATKPIADSGTYAVDPNDSIDHGTFHLNSDTDYTGDTSYTLSGQSKTLNLKFLGNVPIDDPAHAAYREVTDQREFLVWLFSPPVEMKAALFYVESKIGVDGVPSVESATFFGTADYSKPKTFPNVAPDILTLLKKSLR